MQVVSVAQINRYCCSWSVNVVDGVLLILAHAINIPSNGQSPFYRHLYDYKYIYGIWMLEVQIPTHPISYIIISLII